MKNYDFEALKALWSKAPTNAYEMELFHLAAQYLPMTPGEVRDHALVAIHDIRTLGPRASALGRNSDPALLADARAADAREAGEKLARHCLPIVLKAAREWAGRFGSWRLALDAAMDILRTNLPRLESIQTGPRAGQMMQRGWKPQLAVIHLFTWVEQSLAVEMVKAVQKLTQAVNATFIEDVSWSKKVNRAEQDLAGNSALHYPEYWIPRDLSFKMAPSVHTGRRNILPKKGKAPAYLDSANLLVEYLDEYGEIAAFQEHRKYLPGTRPGQAGGRYTQKWVAAQPIYFSRQFDVVTLDLFAFRPRRDNELSGSLSERWLRAAAREEYQAAVPMAAEKAEIKAYEHVTGKKVKVFSRSLLKAFSASDMENFSEAHRREFRSQLNRVSRRFMSLQAPGWAGSLLSGTVAESLDMEVNEDGTRVLDLTQIEKTEGTRYRAPLVPGERAEIAKAMYALPTPLIHAVLNGDVKALANAHRKMVEEKRTKARWTNTCDTAGIHPDEGRFIALSALRFAGARFAPRLTPEHREALKVFTTRFRLEMELEGYDGPRAHVPVITLIREYLRFGRYTGEAESKWLKVCAEQNLKPAQAIELVKRLPVNVQRRTAPRSSSRAKPAPSREFVRWVQRHGERQVHLIDELALEVGQKVSALKAQEYQAANLLLRMGNQESLSRVRSVRVGSGIVVQNAQAPAVLGENGLSTWRETLQIAQGDLTVALERLERATNTGHILLVAAAEIEAERAVEEAQALLIGEDWIADALA
jgi:hypothetical protein